MTTVAGPGQSITNIHAPDGGAPPAWLCQGGFADTTEAPDEPALLPRHEAARTHGAKTSYLAHQQGNPGVKGLESSTLGSSVPI